MREYRGTKELSAMIYGGNATVYVSNMETAIRFYTEVLGLKLTNRFGDHWATVQAGTSMVIGLHPWNPSHPKPGSRGAVQLGLVVSQDVPIARLAERLRRHGVEVSDILATVAGNIITFADPDGNPIYVGDWDPDFDQLPGETLEQRLARQDKEAASPTATK
jgi:catechol 2,3-dioxygenase-like lactoylglutathione lyase family enzyme